VNDRLLPSPEDPVVVLGSGILGSTPFERQTSRYGTVHLRVLDSIPGEQAPARTVPVAPDDDLAARILQELAKSDAGYAAAAAAASETAARRPDHRVVAYDRAPLGATGTLVARVIAVDARFDHSNDPIPELRTPPPGGRVVLGSGTLFTEQYMGVPVIGVRPDDGRDEDWMDSYAITRCRDHLVSLEFEIPKDSALGAAALRRVQAVRQEGDVGLGAGQEFTGQAGPTAQSSMTALPPGGTGRGSASARWRASISFPVGPAVQGTAVARADRRPPRQEPRQARGRQ
jgi:hypothetical protein